MNLAIWPYMKIDGSWTIPIEVIIGAWKTMADMDRVKATFYDGSIENAGEFIEFMQDPTILPALIVDRDDIRLYLLAWLSNISNGTAQGHFCYLDKYRKEIAQKMLDYWRGIPLLRVIVGITPESYTLVLKIIERTGFKIVGTIPEACYMHYHDRTEGGVLSYYLTEGEKDGR